MRYHYSFIYRKCQDCNAKAHCDECDSNLVSSINDISRTRAISVNTKQKLLTVESELDESDLLDELEVIGIFAD